MPKFMVGGVEVNSASNIAQNIKMSDGRNVEQAIYDSPTIVQKEVRTGTSISFQPNVTEGKKTTLLMSGDHNGFPCNGVIVIGKLNSVLTACGFLQTFNTSTNQLQTEALNISVDGDNIIISSLSNNDTYSIIG
ncbi:MAG: hypothetical protein PHW47_08390 [Lachnospira sp.]|nr:hypothetical protein [Lachnospira sp.]